MPVVHLPRQIAFAPDGPHRTFLHQGARARAVLVCLEPGQAIPPHAEPNQGFFFVVEGAGTFTTGEGELPARAGDWIEIPHGTVRGVRADGGRLVLLAHAVS